MDLSQNCSRYSIPTSFTDSSFYRKHLPLYGQSEDWNDDAFTPFWDALMTLGVPLFVTPGYSALPTAESALVSHVITQLERIGTWMNRYPDVTVVLTPWTQLENLL